MAVLGVYQHTKAHAGLHPPSVAQVPAIHFKVQTSILDLLVPSLSYPPFSSWTFLPRLLILLITLVLQPCTLLLSCVLSLCSASSLMIRLGPICWPCSVYFFLCSVLFQVPLALPSFGSTIRNSPLNHTMGQQSYYRSTFLPDGLKKHTNSV